MKKVIATLLLLALLLSLVGCASSETNMEILGTLGEMLEYSINTYQEIRTAEQENPMAGMSINEKIVFVLEEMYQGHTFTIVERYGTNGDEAIVSDENGLEFKIDWVSPYPSYHFRMHDNYMYESLMQRDFLDKMKEIVAKYGYEFEFDDGNLTAEFYVDITDNETTPEELAEVIKEILALAEGIPISKFPVETTTLSTGVVNYYSIPRMNGVFARLETDFCENPNSFLTRFKELNLSDEEFLEQVESEYWTLYERSTLKVLYRPETYVRLDPYKDTADREDVGEQFKRSLRYHMTYELPADFEFFGPHFNSGIEYYHPDHTLNFDGVIYGKRNQIDVYSAVYEFDLNDVELFKSDIEQDIKAQLKDRNDVEIVSFEQYPHDDLTIFQLVLNEPYGAISKHYYIMGDGVFALVEQTTFGESEYHEQTTKHLLETFEWRDIEEIQEDEAY